MGKAKAKFSTSSILKKKINKEFTKKNMWRNIVAKQKPCGENTVAIYDVFFIKKTTKLNSEPTQYEKKPKMIFLGKKIIKKRKNHIGKHCSNSQYFF